MIVLDEQLLGRDIDKEIGRWYRGAVVFVTELRPGSVIKAGQPLRTRGPTQQGN